MARKQKASIQDEYQSLKALLGHRPTATEFYHYIAETGTGFSEIQKHYTGWYDLLSKESDLDKLETDTSLIHQDFLVQGVENASMSKCFKMVLLNAFLELDGFINPPTTKVLADRSWHLLKRHPVLFASELPEKQQSMVGNDAGWHSYWKTNPVKAFIKGQDSFFEIIDERFTFKSEVLTAQKESLHQLVHELMELKLEQYCVRKKLHQR